MVVKNSESNSRKRISFRDDVFLHVIEIIIQFYSLDFFPLKIMSLYTEMKKLYEFYKNEIIFLFNDKQNFNNHNILCVV